VRSRFFWFFIYENKCHIREKYVETSEGFDMLRGERRSFCCPNKLWKALQQKTNGCMSISKYIRNALVEKIIKN
jgi:hypothetical protein